MEADCKGSAAREVHCAYSAFGKLRCSYCSWLCGVLQSRFPLKGRDWERSNGAGLGQGGDDRVRETHRESVRAALQELERYTQARIGNIRAPETTGKFIAAIPGARKRCSINCRKPRQLTGEGRVVRVLPKGDIGI